MECGVAECDREAWIMKVLAHRGLMRHDIYIYIYIQDVPGGMCQTSGECSLS